MLEIIDNLELEQPEKKKKKKKKMMMMMKVWTALADTEVYGQQCHDLAD